MTHPRHETALMLLRAAGFYDHQAKAALASGTAGLTIIRGDILAMAAAVDAREKVLREALAAVMEYRRRANIAAPGLKRAEDLAECWLNGPAWEQARAALEDKL